jgi:hypothetical protein
MWVGPTAGWLRSRVSRVSTPGPGAWAFRGGTIPTWVREASTTRPRRQSADRMGRSSFLVGGE